MTNESVEEIATAAGRSASQPVQVITRAILAAVIAAACGGGVWLYSTDDHLKQVAVHEREQDIKIERNAKATEQNGKTIKKIAVLLVRQGRHVEDMVRAVASGGPVPKRPEGLEQIENEILSSPDR